MKKINFLHFQESYLNAMRDKGASVYLSFGFSQDYIKVGADQLELINDANDCLDYWRVSRRRGGIEIAFTNYLADACRVLSYDPYGRPLVNEKSHRLFLDAIDNSGLWQYEHNRRANGEYSICNSLDIGQRGLDYSTIDYAGDFQFNDPEVATFLPAGKPALLDATNRAVFDKFHQTQKIGKAVRYCLDCLGFCYTDHHVENMVNHIKAANLPIEFKYSSETGDLISEVYDLEAAEGCGSLNNSCMRGHGDYYYGLDACTDVEVIYTTDPAGKLTSRALLWTTRRGTKIMDRIYGTDAMIKAYKDHARAKGYWHKEQQNYDSRRQFVNPEGEEVRTAFAIDINLEAAIADNLVAYMDTFCFYSREQEIITNDLDIAQQVGGDVYELRSTDGDAIEY